MWYFLIIFLIFPVKSFDVNSQLSLKVCPRIEKNNRRVYNGRTARADEVPWHVGLLLPDGSLFCGGSIISKHVVVTAAHCGAYEMPGGFYAVAGLKTQSDNNGTKHLVIKQRFIANWNPEEDIAVLNVFPDFEFNAFVQPIPLTDREVQVGEGPMQIAGWGFYSDKQETSNELKIVDEVYVTKLVKEYPGLVCVDSQESWTCKGDSGGGLVHEGKLVAIVTAGVDNCTTHFFGIYVSIHHHRNLIIGSLDKEDKPKDSNDSDSEGLEDQTEPFGETTEEPTEKPQEQTEAAEKQTEPSEEPTEPNEDPTDPNEDPTEPSEVPTEPAEVPTEPSEDQPDPTEYPELEENTEPETVPDDYPETEMDGAYTDNDEFDCGEYSGEDFVLCWNITIQMRRRRMNLVQN